MQPSDTCAIPCVKTFAEMFYLSPLGEDHMTKEEYAKKKQELEACVVTNSL